MHLLLANVDNGISFQSISLFGFRNTDASSKIDSNSPQDGANESYHQSGSLFQHPDETTHLLHSNQIEVKIKDHCQKEPSLFKVLARVYVWKIARANLCKLVCDALTFVGPLLQR